MKTQPTLRFKLFNQIWDYDLLINLSINQSLSNGVFNDPAHVGSGYKLINVVNMYKEPFIYESDLTLINLDKKTFERNKVVRFDIFFTRSSLVKEGIAWSNIYLGNSWDITYDGHLIKFTPDSSKINPLFLNYNLKSSSVRKQLIKKGKTATMTTIGQSDVASCLIYFPTLAEQNKIADFLSLVDEKIALQNRKVALLQQYKKGMMQKLFSQKIRFKDEGGNDFQGWITSRLSEIGKSFNGLTGKTAKDFGEGADYITYKQIFDDRVIDVTKFEKVKIDVNENQSTVKFGDSFFTTSSETPNEVGFSSTLLEELLESTYLNSFCFGFRPDSFDKLLPEFSPFLFDNESFRKNVILLAQGSTRFNISKNKFMEIKVDLPCIEEQRKIANFLSSIDDKITLENTKLDKLKQWKQGLLQQMFV